LFFFLRSACRRALQQQRKRKANMHGLAKNFRKRSSQKIMSLRACLLSGGTPDRSKAPSHNRRLMQPVKGNDWNSENTSKKEPLAHKEGGAYFPSPEDWQKLQKRMDDLFPSSQPFRGTDWLSMRHDETWIPNEVQIMNEK
jgi:hypothetical protein